MHTDITQCTINDKERILKAARERKMVIYKEMPLDYHWIAQQSLYKLTESGIKYLNY